jgi:uncharacterized protein
MPVSPIVEVIPEEVTPLTQRPVRRAVMVQGWHNLTSVHWSFDPQVVQELLPPGFVVDTFDGRAWVGLIPFAMHRIGVPLGRGRRLTAGRFSSFPETNVRTYIVDSRGRRAVWFFSLDINRLAPALVARVTYGLPYCWSSMTIEDATDTVCYRSERRWPRSSRGASSTVTVRVGERLTDDSPTHERDAFLSARWALGSTFLGRRLWAFVEHPQWELHHGELLECDETLLRASGLPPSVGDPVVLWSPGVDVRIARPELLPR